MFLLFIQSSFERQQLGTHHIKCIFKTSLLLSQDLVKPSLLHELGLQSLESR